MSPGRAGYQKAEQPGQRRSRWPEINEGCSTRYTTTRISRLLQRSIDRREHGVEVRAQAVHHGNNRESNSGCD